MEVTVIGIVIMLIVIGLIFVFALLGDRQKNKVVIDTQIEEMKKEKREQNETAETYLIRKNCREETLLKKLQKSRREEEKEASKRRAHQLDQEAELFHKAYPYGKIFITLEEIPDKYIFDCRYEIKEVDNGFLVSTSDFWY